MKKRLIPIALVMGALSANAQVGIGTNKPNKSAELIIESSNRGLLIPNVKLTDTKDSKTISNGNVNSLMVFNTSDNSSIKPGYYYWFIDTWHRLASDSEIPSIVVNQFEQILNMQGDKVENLIKQIVLNTSGNVIYEGDKLYHINDAGQKVEINFSDIVKLHETVTTLDYNRDTNILTYVNEKGQPKVVDLNVGGIEYSPQENRIIYTDADGMPTHLDLNKTSLKYNKDKGVLTYISSDGSSTEINIKDLLHTNETVTTLKDNKDGTYTYTSEDNTETIINVPGSVVEQFENIYNQIVNEEITVKGDLYNSFEEYLTQIVHSNTNFKDNDFIEVTGDGTENSPFEITIKEGDADSMLITNEKGELEWVTIADIVKANETVTTLVDNKDGTYTYKNEKGTETIIDVPGSVVENFENIYNHIVNEEITVKGDLYNSFEEYLTQIVHSNTNFKDNDFIEVTGDGTENSPFEITIKEGDADSMLITNEKGELEWVTIADIVKANETVTTLVDNKDGTYTYKNEKGTETIIDVPGSVVENFENIYNQIVNEEITVKGDLYNSFEEYLTQIVHSNTNFKDNDFIEVTGDGTENSPFEITIKEGDADSMLITNEKGELEWVTIADIVKANETVTTLVDNKDGTYTYKNEKGTETIIDVPGSVVENFENIYNQIVNEEITVKGDLYNSFEEYLTQIVHSNTNFKDNDFIEVTGDGTENSPFEITIKEGDADSMLITNEKGELEWVTIADIVKSNETVTTLVKNDNGTYTYYNEEDFDKGGNPLPKSGVTIDPALVIVEDLSKDEGRYVFKDSEGNVLATIDVNSNNILYDNSNSGLAADNVQDALDELVAKIENKKGNLSLAGGLEFITDTNGAGKLLADAGIQISDGGVTTDKLGDKAVTSDKIKGGEDGDILVSNADGSTSWINKKDATSNSLALDGNKLTSTVNGVVAEVSLTDENISSSKGITGTEITVKGGENATLKDVTLSITPGDDNTVMTTKDGAVTWVPQSEIVPNTTNVLSKKAESNGNTLISTVNGVASETTLIEYAGNSIVDGKLVTTINGKASEPLDLTDVVQAGQLRTEVIEGVNTTVSTSTEGNTTKYAVNISKEAIQGAVTLDGDVTGTAGNNTLSKIQGTELNTEGKVEGNVLIFKDGKWVPGTPDINVENILDAKSLTAALDASEDEENPSTNTTIEVVDGIGATLKDTSIRVKGESITTDHIQNGTIKPVDLAKAGADNVLSTDSEGTPVWKKEAPRFFYMPAVIFDTAVNGEGERDLYQEYVNQFEGIEHNISHGVNGNSSITYTGGLVGSEGAPTKIAVYSRGEMYYYVSYYDTSVFEDLAIDENGVLTYKVIGNATPRSYMNIVFVIK